MSKKFTQLKNPKTARYQTVKEGILSTTFPWYYSPSDKWNPEFFSHQLLQRPNEISDGNCKYSKPTSSQLEPVIQSLYEIWNHNNINVECVYRVNVNLVMPLMGVKTTSVHVDHSFPHKNILVYLTNAGGKTVCENESYDPKEDDVVIFDGLPHYIHLPAKNRRIVIVATYI